METFLPSYNEIGPVVSDKKIFQVFLAAMFLTNPNGLNNLGTESPKEHFCKII